MEILVNFLDFRSKASRISRMTKKSSSPKRSASRSPRRRNRRKKKKRSPRLRPPKFTTRKSPRGKMNRIDEEQSSFGSRGDEWSRSDSPLGKNKKPLFNYSPEAIISCKMIQPPAKWRTDSPQRPVVHSPHPIPLSSQSEDGGSSSHGYTPSGSRHQQGYQRSPPSTIIQNPAPYSHQTYNMPYQPPMTHSRYNPQKYTPYQQPYQYHPHPGRSMPRPQSPLTPTSPSATSTGREQEFQRSPVNVSDWTPTMEAPFLQKPQQPVTSERYFAPTPATRPVRLPINRPRNRLRPRLFRRRKQVAVRGNECYANPPASYYEGDQYVSAHDRTCPYSRYNLSKCTKTNCDPSEMLGRCSTACHACGPRCSEHCNHVRSPRRRRRIKKCPGPPGYLEAPVQQYPQPEPQPVAPQADRACQYSPLTGMCEPPFVPALSIKDTSEMNISTRSCEDYNCPKAACNPPNPFQPTFSSNSLGSSDGDKCDAGCQRSCNSNVANQHPCPAAFGTNSVATSALKCDTSCQNSCNDNVSKHSVGVATSPVSHHSTGTGVSVPVSIGVPSQKSCDDTTCSAGGIKFQLTQPELIEQPTEIFDMSNPQNIQGGFSPPQSLYSSPKTLAASSARSILSLYDQTQPEVYGGYMYYPDQGGVVQSHIPIVEAGQYRDNKASYLRSNLSQRTLEGNASMAQTAPGIFETQTETRSTPRSLAMTGTNSQPSNQNLFTPQYHTPSYQLPTSGFQDLKNTGVQCDPAQSGQQPVVMRDALIQNSECEEGDCYCTDGMEGGDIKFSKGTSPMSRPQQWNSAERPAGGRKCLCHIKIGLGSPKARVRTAKHRPAIRKRPVWRHGMRDEPNRPRKDLYSIGSKFNKKS